MSSAVWSLCVCVKLCDSMWDLHGDQNSNWTLIVPQFGSIIIFIKYLHKSLKVPNFIWGLLECNAKYFHLSWIHHHKRLRMQIPTKWSNMVRIHLRTRHKHYTNFELCSPTFHTKCVSYIHVVREEKYGCREKFFWGLLAHRRSICVSNVCSYNLNSIVVARHSFSYSCKHIHAYTAHSHIPSKQAKDKWNFRLKYTLNM